MRLMRACIVALVAVGLAACASTPAQPTNAPTLAYALPPVNPARYAIADTTRVALATPDGRNLNTTIALAGQADLSVHVDSVGLLSSVRLQAVTGLFQVGNQVSLQVDSTDLPTGAALFRLSDRGVDSTMHTPGMSMELIRVAGGGSFFQHFFVRLPGGATETGATWTDTLTLNDDGAGVRSRTRVVVTSTFVGDTTIDAMVLRVIGSRLSINVDVQGVVDGVQVSQRLIGTGDATTLWDDARDLLVAREETGVASGTMDMPTIGMSSVPVQARYRRVIRLVP